jgi:hypothetical protein
MIPEDPLGHTFVAKLWPEYPTLGVEETVKNVKICRNGRNYVMAATPRKVRNLRF